MVRLLGARAPSLSAGRQRRRPRGPGAHRGGTGVCSGCAVQALPRASGGRAGGGAPGAAASRLSALRAGAAVSVRLECEERSGYGGKPDDPAPRGCGPHTWCGRVPGLARRARPPPALPVRIAHASPGQCLGEAGIVRAVERLGGLGLAEAAVEMHGRPLCPVAVDQPAQLADGQRCPVPQSLDRLAGVDRRPLGGKEPDAGDPAHAVGIRLEEVQAPFVYRLGHVFRAADGRLDGQRPFSPGLPCRRCGVSGWGPVRRDSGQPAGQPGPQSLSFHSVCSCRLRPGAAALLRGGLAPGRVRPWPWRISGSTVELFESLEENLVVAGWRIRGRYGWACRNGLLDLLPSVGKLGLAAVPLSLRAPNVSALGGCLGRHHAVAGAGGAGLSVSASWSASPRWS